MKSNQPLTITEGELSTGAGSSKKQNPYSLNDFKGTKEIQKTFKRISKRHPVKSWC